MVYEVRDDHLHRIGSGLTFCLPPAQLAIREGNLGDSWPGEGTVNQETLTCHPHTPIHPRIHTHTHTNTFYRMQVPQYNHGYLW